ncbi:oligosaccharide flippase family protein [Pseudoalteromonas sp. SSM20]|uniref:oligosaccharide flippase family protein n=1 Tax=Pseudoalteromonas sp. SSM20 TaxID=3139394 RepID=UPI003BADB4E4
MLRKLSKTKKASIVVIATYVLSQILKLGSNLILTRLLAPEFFGFMAFAFSILVLLTMLCDLGVNTSLVRNQDSETKEFRNTAFTLQVTVGFIIATLVLCLALAIYLGQEFGVLIGQNIYAHSDTPILLLLVAIQPIITAFRSTKVAFASKHMDYGVLSSIEIASQVIGSVVSIGLAYFYPSLWGLIFASLLAVFINVVAGHIFLTGERDAFGWNALIFKRIFSFGKWVVLSSLVTATLTQVDKLIFAAYITPEQMGVYAIAGLLFLSIQQVILTINSKVLFPKFSAAYNAGENLQLVFYNVRKKIDFFAFFCFATVFFCAKTIVDFLFSADYALAGDLLQLLSLQLLFISVSFSTSIYMAIGKPKLATIVTGIEALTKIALILILFELYGFYIAILGSSLYGVISFCVTVYINRHIQLFDLKKELLSLVSIIPCLLLGYLAGIVIYFLSRFIG